MTQVRPDRHRSSKPPPASNPAKEPVAAALLALRSDMDDLCTRTYRHNLANPLNRKPKE